MRFRKAALAGLAAVAIAGTAMATGHDSHFLNVAMPDGTIARIEYQGDVAPTLSVVRARPVALPVALLDPFDANPFAALDRVAAQMDRQMDAMMRQAVAIRQAPAGPDGGIDLTAFGAVPAGTVHYSYVSTSSGAGTCSRTVRISSGGAGEQPKVISNSSGDCGSGAAAPDHVADRAAPVPDGLIRTSLPAPAAVAAKPKSPTI